MKTRLAYALAIAALTALLVPASALALDSMHGNFADDTDACAGCHRAHTSYSTVTWTDGNLDEQSALLVGDGAALWEMCYACHGPGAPGSTTDVEEGLLYGGVPGDLTRAVLGDLNGGAFDIIAPSGTWTSSHAISGSWGAWGGGTTQGIDPVDGITGTGPKIAMDCTSCHDPHGSPNYRILAVRPGGFTLPDAQPYVSSVETGFPYTTGFVSGTKYPSYVPNYTTPLYGKGWDTTGATVDRDKGMSGWCSGCHTQYLSLPTNLASQQSTYAASEWIGADNVMLRHRHPMNVALNEYDGTNSATVQAQAASLEATGIPLAHDPSSERGALKTSTSSDWVECLTCHRAHGTKATMTGWASLAGMSTPKINGDLGEIPSNPYVGASVSALLRKNNRTACQMCHKK